MIYCYMLVLSIPFASILCASSQINALPHDIQTYIHKEHKFSNKEPKHEPKTIHPYYHQLLNMHISIPIN